MFLIGLLLKKFIQVKAQALINVFDHSCIQVYTMINNTNAAYDFGNRITHSMFKKILCAELLFCWLHTRFNNLQNKSMII